MRRTRQAIKQKELIGKQASYVLPAQEVFCSDHGWFLTRVYQSHQIDDAGQVSRVVVKEYMLSPAQGITQEECLKQAIHRILDCGMMLSHPHICATRELVEERYMVYEWAGDIHLQRLLRSNQTVQVSYDATFALCCQLASAFCHLYQTLASHDHFRGYGDLHPYNVMIREQDTIFFAALIDFDNLCRPDDPSVSRGNAQDFLPGTRALYDAPELLLGTVLHADVLSDIFSFGMLSYRLLFGDWPYEDVEDYPELLHAIQRKKGIGYQSWDGFLRAEGQKENLHPPFDLSLLHQVILPMIAPYREERYPSFDRVVQALATVWPR